MSSVRSYDNLIKNHKVKKHIDKSFTIRSNIFKIESEFAILDH